MRIGVITDATCDLPADFLRAHRVGILPITIRLGSDYVLDERDPSVTLRFYSEQLAARGLDAQTLPLMPDQIREHFLERIVLDYDYVFCITVMAARSPIYENATKAAFSILNDYKAVRAAAGVAGPFALRVIDSRTLFVGTGVLVAQACKLIAAGLPANDIRVQLEALRARICAYLIPGDLFYLRNRGLKQGEKSVSWLTYAMGSALDIKPVILAHGGTTQPVAKVRGYERAVERLFAHAAEQIRQGVETRHLAVGYGGDPAQLPQLPGYAALARTAQQHGIELLPALMSATSAVNVGGGCVTLAYGGELRPFL